ncbi:hypothetical protein [Spirosoma sp. KNUC1025]|uniref:hypothetical protein n=1 Tax=Spirosoma sp. KNUC1025 TaxID=2894082 RepID=UPI00386A7255|nr:hypothetical protein LN737_06640 [Spirosoma sp. KNUC1025]
MDLELRTLRPPRYQKFDDNFFFALCQANETTRLERDASGNIIFIQVLIYRGDGSIEIKHGPTVTLSGEGVLPELSMQLTV